MTGDLTQYCSFRKNNPFALSLSKGLVDETLRQAQGERGLSEQY